MKSIPRKKGDCHHIHCPNCVYYGTNNCVFFRESKVQAEVIEMGADVFAASEGVDHDR